MSTVAIIGAGPLGGALARTLGGPRPRRRSAADRSRGADRRGQGARHPAVVAGRAVQHARDGRHDLCAAAGADVIVLADLASGGEIAGEAGPGAASTARADGDHGAVPVCRRRAARADDARDRRAAPGAAAPAGIGAAGARVGGPRGHGRVDGREPGRPGDRRGGRASARRGHWLGRGDGLQPAHRGSARAASPVVADVAAARAVAAAALHAGQRGRARRRGAGRGLAPPLHVLRRDRRHGRRARHGRGRSRSRL